MFYVYLLRSKARNWIYIGCTEDLKIRLLQHRKGEVASIKAHRPFTLVYYEAYLSKKDARTRESHLKNNGSQKEFLFKQIAESVEMAK